MTTPADMAGEARAARFEEARSTFAPGDQVTVASERWPGVWTVVKVNKVNLKLEQGPRRLNASPTYVTKVDGSTPAPTFTATTVPLPTIFDPGATARVRGRDGLWVVIRDAGADRVNLARIGGENGRYLRAPRSLVTPVKVTVTEVAP
jgi:hypothetical protein